MSNRKFKPGVMELDRGTFRQCFRNILVKVSRQPNA